MRPSEGWLTIKGTGSAKEAGEYYAAIGAPATLAEWFSTYRFGLDETSAVYYNDGDLGFGRDMHCRHWVGPDVACYVVNHGLGPGAPADLSVDDAIDHKNVQATVAMVQDSFPHSVKFYVYGADGKLLTKVALDSERGRSKFVPQLCLSCHGGTYDDESNTVTPPGASFLPFDLDSFQFSTRPGFAREDQEEKFRELNALVLDSSPAQPIRTLIEKWYEKTGGVRKPEAKQDNTYRPPSFDGAPGLYDDVVKPYCRTCHIAGADIGDPSRFSKIARSFVYESFNGWYMPHAERTAHKFWRSGAPASLANDRKWSIRVTITGDPEPDGCEQNGCSLREAIIAANAAAASPTPIITFDVDGPFVLTQAGVGEDEARVGDLDIIRDVVILGKGAAKTIIDGGRIDRVYDIRDRAHAVIQGVTIQGGDTASDGGGIRVLGSTLTLDTSVVKNNGAVGTGGGLSAQPVRIFDLTIKSTLDITSSTIGPSNHASGGGGLASVDSKVTVRDSTVTSNTAGSMGGGGILNESGARLSVVQATIALNRADGAGGGIAGQSNSFTSVDNSIVGGNISPVDFDCSFSGRFSSDGSNLVGQFSRSNGCVRPGFNSNLITAGSISSAIDTDLAGAVPYHRPAVNSQASDAVVRFSLCSPPSYDQRGVARPLDGDSDLARSPACDVGAYEVNAPPPTNLVRNSGFELDADHDGRPDDWNARGTVGRKFLNDDRELQRVSGDLVAELRATTGKDAGVAQSFSVRAGRTYRLAGWLRIPEAKSEFTFESRFEFLDRDGAVISSAAGTYSDDTNERWLPVESAGTAPVGAVTFRVEMIARSSGARTIYLDHFAFRDCGRSKARAC